jgi:hypothetical protein
VPDTLFKQCSVLWACADYDPSLVASCRPTTTFFYRSTFIDISYMYISNSNSPFPSHVRDIVPSTYYIDRVQLLTTVRGRHRMTKGAGKGKSPIIGKITGKNSIQ